MRKISLIVKFLIIFSLFLVAKESDPITEQVNKLNVRLQLTDNQNTQIKDILKKYQAIRKKDQELFKTDAVRLIRAAHERRENTNREIEKILNPEQKEEFKKIVKMTLFDRELFELTEGLLLSEDQAFDLEGVLIDLQNEFNQFAPDGFMPGMGGRTGGGRKGSGTVSEDYSKRMKRYMDKMRKRILAKKSKAIKKMLNREQKKLYQQIIKDRENKRKALD